MGRKKPLWFVPAGEKGQAFDVFKLLIAAVVAMFILGILFSVLGMLPTFGQSQPGPKASDEVKTRLSYLGSRTITDVVNWSIAEELYSYTIAKNSGSLEAEQVCVLPGNFDGHGSFNVVSEGRRIEYTSSNQMKTKLAVLCEYTNQLKQNITDLKVEWADQVDSCECLTKYQDTSTVCCIVVIVRNT